MTPPPTAPRTPLRQRSFLTVCLTLAFALATATLPSAAAAAALRPTHLRCEYRVDPAGIDVPHPRLGWALAPTSDRARGLDQAAFQILVASTPDLLRPGRADLWDSGVVESTETTFVPYAGPPLRSATVCFWKVRSRTADGAWSAWSEPARWTTGLLGATDWTADWIGSGESFVRGNGRPENPDRMPPDPWLRKSVVLDRVPARALAFVASVGFHELWINGRKVGDAVLQPSVTDNSKRARYDTYEVAAYLRPGTNVLGLWLGSGWSIYPKFTSDDKPRGPIVRAQFEFTAPDGRSSRCTTDATWKTHPSPSTLLGVWDFTNFGGELYDASKEVPDWSASTDDTGWTAARVFHPRLVVSSDPVEPNRLRDELKPIAIEETQPGVWRVDFGRNFAGFLEAKVHGQPGDRLEFQWSEQEKRPMTHRLRDVYVVGPRGDGTFRNRFNYGIGRWLTVTGLRSKPALADFRGWLVRTDYASASAFECSNPLFNRIESTALWTYENLSLGGYLVDCPHRERMGYGGDAHATTTLGLLGFRTGALYSKWAEDWRDAQGRTSSWGPGNSAATASDPGSLPYTAPTYWGGGGPGWCGYVVHLPSEMARLQGDRQIVEKMLPTIERWLASLETKQRDDLLRRWGGEWDFLGDWLWPGANGVNGDTRETLCFNNCYWIYNLQTAARLAALVGRTSLADAWNLRAEQVRRAVHREFFVPAEASYVDGSPVYLALALVANVPPPELRSAVAKRLETEILVRRHGHIHAGITGGAFLFKALRELGRDDLLATMIAQTDYPGWGDMLRQGATTFWESWENNPDLSYLHSSYLYVGTWFVEGVLGIQAGPANDGFAHFVIRPAPLDRPDLNWARGHLDAIHGRIRSSWTRRPDRFDLEVTVPPNTRATVALPAREVREITESGRALDRAHGVQPRGVEGDRLLVEVGSGTYRFAVRTKPEPSR